MAAERAHGAALLPPTRIIVIYQPVAELPVWLPGTDQFVATTPEEFQNLLNQYTLHPDFAGTIVVTDDPTPQGTWPPTSAGDVHLRLRFRDVAYYNDVWLALFRTGWVPRYAQGQEAQPVPPPSDAIFDLDLWQRLNDTTAQIIKLRVRRDDGAIAVSSTKSIGIQPAGSAASAAAGEGCDAGPYWPICCGSQELFCNLLCGWLRLLGSDYCDECSDDCYDCVVSNPCHSCGFCGLSWLLSRFVPGGNC